MAYDIYEGKQTTIEFESGVMVQGKVVTGKRNLQGKIVLICFENCTVSLDDRILFAPEWGVYDMAVGKAVISAYGGPADASSFEQIRRVPGEKTIQVQHSTKTRELVELYQQVRDFRVNDQVVDLAEILFALKKDHPGDWLLALELLELTDDQSEIYQSLKTYLGQQGQKLPHIKHLIEFGMEHLSQYASTEQRGK